MKISKYPEEDIYILTIDMNPQSLCFKLSINLTFVLPHWLIIDLVIVLIETAN